MPLKQQIYSLLLLSVCVLAACSSDETRLAGDPAKSAQLSQLNARIDAGNRLTAGEFEFVKSTYETFPKSRTAATVYEKSLIQRKDWGTLAAYYESTRNSDPESKKKLSQTYIKLGKYREAYEIVRGLDLDSDAELRRIATLALFQTGKYDEAAQMLDKNWESIETKNEFGEMAMRGMIYFYDGEENKALELLNKVIESDPGNVTANNGLSRIYSSRGETPKARESLDRVQKSIDKITAEERAKTQYVENIYKLQDHYKNKRFEQVILVGGQLAPDATVQQRLIIYQYMYNSQKALGNEQGAKAILEKARQLKQK